MKSFISKERYCCKDCGNEFGYKDVIEKSFSSFIFTTRLPILYISKQCPGCGSKKSGLK